jgi:hypothetical protein
MIHVTILTMFIVISRNTLFRAQHLLCALPCQVLAPEFLDGQRDVVVESGAIAKSLLQSFLHLRLLVHEPVAELSLPRAQIAPDHLNDLAIAVDLDEAEDSNGARAAVYTRPFFEPAMQTLHQ